MNMRDAWNSVSHGEAITNPATGTVIHKWIGEKPGHEPGFSRFLESNINTLSVDDILALTWEKLDG